MLSIRPTRKLLLLFAPGVALAAVGGGSQAVLVAVIALNVLVLGAFWLDARAARAAQPYVTRAVPHTVMREKAFAITYTLENRSARAAAVAVDDRFPAHIEPREVSLRARLAPGARETRSFTLT